MVAGLTRFLILLLACAPEALAQASAYPSKPVRIIVPLAPGGGADTFGRYLARQLSDSLGQQFIVENRPGGGGLVGGEYVARAAPDGYTLLGGRIRPDRVEPHPSAPRHRVVL